jgi:hypothetical protein
MEESRYQAFADCVRFDGELEAHLEGEARPFVLSHSQACSSCGSLLADLESLRGAARELPLEEPSHATWAGIRATLEAEGVLTAAPCLQFTAELAAYLEGEAHPFVISHSQDCPSCGALLADLQSIRQAARELPWEEPSRATWANVRARLEAEGAFQERLGGWRQILAWRPMQRAIPLAVVAVALFVGAVLTLPSKLVQRWSGGDEAKNTPTVSQFASAALANEDGALARLVSELESNFRANETSMAPDLKATYEKSLVSLDGSIQECLDSLRYEPRNTLAHDYLLAAYTRKAEVLSSALEFEGR